MSASRKWLSEYQGNQPNHFNEEVIYGLRERDNMVDYLVDTCKALEAIPYIKYKGYTLVTNEDELSKSDFVNISDSRLDLVTFRFTITFNDKVINTEMPIYIPKWINKYYFILNGNKYYPIYQTLESSTYNTKDSVILKSLLMPIILKMKSAKITDSEGNEYVGRSYLVHLFSHKSNFLYYFFATMGLNETIKFFGYEKNIKITNAKMDLNKVIMFPITKQYSLAVSRKKFNNNSAFKYFIMSMMEMFNKKTQIDKIYSVEYWMVKLGSNFTKNTNNQKTKAETVILSFKRILDERTKKNLLLPEEEKKDIYHLIRWMMNNFDSLMRKDNLSLLNKRLRLCEYIITPFVRKMSNSTYRILNSKTLNINKIEGILKPNPMVIISDLQKSRLLRYNNATNDMDLFNCALKWSNRGPSSIGEGSRNTVSVAYRGIHPSHLGRLSLNTLSNSDPGMTGVLSPFVETNGFYYSTTGEIELLDENEEVLESEE